MARPTADTGYDPGQKRASVNKILRWPAKTGSQMGRGQRQAVTYVCIH
jgi:hypothetical protein